MLLRRVVTSVYAAAAMGTSQEWAENRHESLSRIRHLRVLDSGQS